MSCATQAPVSADDATDDAQDEGAVTEYSDGADRSPAAAKARRKAPPPSNRGHGNQANQKGRPQAPRALGVTRSGCNLDAISKVTIGGDISVLEVLPRISKNGSIAGVPQMLTGRNSRGQMVQSMVVDLRNDRAILSPFFGGDTPAFSELQSAMNDAANTSFEGESSYRSTFAPQKAVHALNSAMSFINGNYTTVTVVPRRTGHLMAAALASIMATIDYPGCSEYFIAEAGKTMSPEHAAYLNDFPFRKIRDARKGETIGDDFVALGKKREKLHKDIEDVDGLLAQTEQNNEQRLKQLEQLLKLELQSLKLALGKFPPCQTVLAYEMAVFNPLKKTEAIAESWISRCREAIGEYSADIEARLLTMEAEKQVMTRQNEILADQKILQTNDGAKKITQDKIDRNVAKMAEYDLKAKEIEIKKRMVDTYGAQIPLRGSDPPSSINLALDKITKYSEEQRNRRSGKVFNDDHQRMTELRRDYFGVTKDYVTLGIFGGAVAAGQSSTDDDN